MKPPIAYYGGKTTIAERIVDLLPARDRTTYRAATAQEIEACRELVPFLEAGMVGLERARWMPGHPVEDLVAPIVMAVLVEVGKQLPLKQMTAALEAARKGT